MKLPLCLAVLPRCFLVAFALSYGRRQGCYTIAIPFSDGSYTVVQRASRGAFIRSVLIPVLFLRFCDAGIKPADLAGGCIATAESHWCSRWVFRAG